MTSRIVRRSSPQQWPLFFQECKGAGYERRNVNPLALVKYTVYVGRDAHITPPLSSSQPPRYHAKESPTFTNGPDETHCGAIRTDLQHHLEAGIHRLQAWVLHRYSCHQVDISIRKVDHSTRGTSATAYGSRIVSDGRLQKMREKYERSRKVGLFLLFAVVLLRSIKGTRLGVPKPAVRTRQ